jgi:lactoylglutathione lyase
LSDAGWPGFIGAITLFSADLQATRRFYAEVLGLTVFFETEDSVVYRLGETLLNFIELGNAPELVAPARVATADDGARFVFSLGVEDVDARCAELAEHGVELVNGPMDRPWGLRTASFADPDGYIWEISHSL